MKSLFYEYHIMWSIMATLVLMLGYILWRVIFSWSNTKQRALFSFALVNSVLAVFAFGIYIKLGSYHALKERYSLQAIEQTLVSLHDTPQLSKAQVVSTFKNLEKKLTRSENIWVKLADIYQALNLYELAAYAYEQALIYHPAFEPYEMQKIYCQVMLKEGTVDESALFQLRRMLEERPTHKGILNLLALHAYQHQDYPMALVYWQRILKYSENIAGTEQEAIESAIAKTKQLLGVLPSDDTFKLKIELAIAPELSTHLSENDTIFVIAKSLGQPMPVAVRKLQVGDFPMWVELSNEDAMIEGRLLSDLKEIQLIARVSKSGDPLPQEGDLEGQFVLEDMASAEQILIQIDRINKSVIRD